MLFSPTHVVTADGALSSNFSKGTLVMFKGIRQSDIFPNDMMFFVDEDGMEQALDIMGDGERQFPENYTLLGDVK